MRANYARALIACGAGLYLAASAHSVVLAEYRKKEMTAGAGRYLWEVEHDVKEEAEAAESEAPEVVDIDPEEWETEVEETEATEAENEEPTSKPVFSISEEEYELLARLVAAEAEDQGFEAQYDVACVVMNRVLSGRFPDTITEVIWQPRQFSSMWNGRYDRTKTTESCYEAVKHMLKVGTGLPEDVLYFTSCGYLKGTDPYIRVNEMYFSKQRG